MAKSTLSKPSRPDGFPLFAHATRRWAKKIRGKLHYFGPWDDRDAALSEWLRVKDDLLAGRKPRQASEGFTVADMCNDFLEYKESEVDTGDITQRTWNEYEAVSKTMCKVWGRDRLVSDIKPVDFQPLRATLGKNLRPKTIQSRIGRTKAILNFAYDNDWVESKIKSGRYFKKPTAKVIRLDQAAQDHQGEKDLQAGQINDLMKIANTQMKAMILLAANTGMGNADCAKLEFRHVDLEDGWLDFPRPKTGVKRRAKLWTETIDAILDVVAVRKKPKNETLADLIFITKYGQGWHKDSTTTNPVSAEFRKLLKAKGHHINGVGFYSLRRTFETVASETKDQPAIDLSMGHEGTDMASLYRQKLGDNRLEAVADHVRKWLYGKRGAK